jgi:ATP-dependent Lon protease
VVVFPEANKHDWEELQEDLKAGLEPHFVEHYHQIFALALEHDAPITQQPAPPEAAAAAESK